MSLGTIAALSAMLAVPGLGAVLAAYGPGRPGIATGLALVPALGYGVAGTCSFVLTLLGVLRPATVFPVLGVVTVLLWLVGLRRGSLRVRVRAAGAELRADPWALGLGLAVMVSIAVIAISFSPALTFGSSSSWRYWADAREIADAGRIPARSIQYGVLLKPTTSKSFLNAFVATVALGPGRDMVAAFGAMVWVGAVGFALGLWAVGRELGLRLTAPLLPVLTIMNRSFLYKEISSDLHVFKAETFGRMAAVAAVAVAVRAIRGRRGWGDALLGGAMFGVSAGTHLVPTLIGVLAVGWYAVTRLLRESGRGSTLARTAVVGATAAALALGVLFLPRGDLGLQGSGGAKSYASFGPRFDPTRYLSAGVTKSRPRTGRFYISPVDVYRGYVARATRILPGSRLGDQWLVPLEALLAIGGLLLAVAALLWFPPAVRSNVLMAWGLGASLVAVAIYFSWRYHEFVLAWFGVRRLFDYSSVPLVLMALTLIEAAVVLAPRVRVPSAAAVAAGLAVVVLGGALLLPDAYLSGLEPTRQRAAPLDWIRANIPCDARILMRERTAGVLEAATGRVGVVEGMAPHLRPAVLKPVVKLLLAARAFFADPVRRASFLRGEAIDYVIVTGRIAGYRSPLGKDVDIGLLDAVPALRLIHDGDGLRVYRVVPPPSNHGRYPSSIGYPGYTCARGPLL